VLQAAGPQQLRADQPAGCVVAIHVLREIFDPSDAEASRLMPLMPLIVSIDKLLLFCPLSIFCKNFYELLLRGL